MAIGRRSLLRTFGCFVATQLLSGRSAFALKTLTEALERERNGVPEASALLLFEGPWIFDQVSSGTLRASTFGAFDRSAVPHQCEVGLGAPSSSVLINPIDPDEEPFLLPVGANWKISVPAHHPDTDFQSLFERPLGKDPFVWVRHRNPQVILRKGDRSVSLPLPTSIYVGGRLETAVIADPSRLLAPTLSSPQPYVATILEYARKDHPIELFLTKEDEAKPIQLPTNGHLIFRMERDNNSPATNDIEDVPYVKRAFAELGTRISTPEPAHPLELSTLKNISCDVGQDVRGFDRAEMGIRPIYEDRVSNREVRPFAKNHNSYQLYANRLGGGIVVGS